MPSLVARRQGDRVRVDARGRPGGVGGERRRRRRAQGGDARRGRVDAPSWGPRRPDRVSRDDRRRPRRQRRRAGDVALRNRRQDRSPAARTSSRSAPRGRRRRSSTTSRTARSASAASTAARRRPSSSRRRMQVTRAAATYTRRKRDFTSIDAAPGARHRPSGDLAGRQADRVRGRRRHLRDAGRRQAGEPHQGRRARHRSGVVAGRLAARLLVRQGQRAPAALDPRHEDGPQPPAHRPDDAAAGRGVVAGRQAHRLLQRRRHVARGADVGASTSRPAR